jgi:hypothetical protein
VTAADAAIPKVSFRVSTYYKLPRGQAGITHLDSQRLNLGEALDWIAAELPEDAVTITPETDEGDKVTIVIDWAKVPDEIRAGTQRMGAKR